MDNPDRTVEMRMLHEIAANDIETVRHPFTLLGTRCQQHARIFDAPEREYVAVGLDAERGAFHRPAHEGLDAALPLIQANILEVREGNDAHALGLIQGGCVPDAKARRRADLVVAMLDPGTRR